MSKPRTPDPAKLLLAAIYRDAAALEKCLARLAARLGPVDYSSAERPWTFSAYYEKEMGAPLFRRFFAFKNLVDPGELPALKLFTNQLEENTAREGARTVNLDPGLLSMTNLVLATGKPAAHRPYLGQGIYADLTLIFERGSFRALPWTYPDYASSETINFLNRLRESYKLDLKEWRKTGEDEIAAGESFTAAEQGENR